MNVLTWAVMAINFFIGSYPPEEVLNPRLTPCPMVASMLATANEETSVIVFPIENARAYNFTGSLAILPKGADKFYGVVGCVTADSDTSIKLLFLLIAEKDNTYFVVDSNWIPVPLMPLNRPVEIN